MRSRVQRINDRLESATGFRISRPQPSPWPRDMSQTIEAVSPFTMTSEDRIVSVCDAVDYLSSSDIEGAVVECGVWRGGSMMAAALRLQERQDLRDLWLYDTFDGVPEPDPSTDGYAAVTAWRSANPRRGGSDWCLADLADVTANMQSTGYPADRIHYVEGMVEDTIPRELPDQVALLRVDTDLYSSTRHILTYLTPRMTPGGVVIFDDYGTWQGARKAVDEWRSMQVNPVMLHRVGTSSARIATI